MCGDSSPGNFDFNLNTYETSGPSTVVDGWAEASDVVPPITITVPQEQATHDDGVKTGYTMAVVDDLLANLYGHSYYDEDGNFAFVGYPQDVQALKLALNRLRTDISAGLVPEYELIDAGWISSKIAR